MLFIQRDSGCLTYLRKQWECAGFFIYYHENRSMNCTLEKQIFHFSCQTRWFLVEKKVFYLCFPQKRYVNSLPLLFLFLFSFNVSIRKETIMTRSIFLNAQIQNFLGSFAPAGRGPLQGAGGAGGTGPLEHLGNRRERQQVRKSAMFQICLSLCPNSLKLFHVNVLIVML